MSKNKMISKKLLIKKLEAIKIKRISFFYVVFMIFFILLYLTLNSTLVSASHSNCLTPDCGYTRCVSGKYRCTQWPSCSNPGNPIVRCGHEPVSEACSCNKECGARCAVDSDCPKS